MKFEIINWQTLKNDCQYDHDNDGYEFGIHYLDEDEQVIDAEWFKTEEERTEQINILTGQNNSV